MDGPNNSLVWDQDKQGISVLVHHTELQRHEYKHAQTDIQDNLQLSTNVSTSN